MEKANVGGGFASEMRTKKGAEMEVETIIAEDLMDAAKEKGVKVVKKSVSIVSGDTPSVGLLRSNKVMLHYHKGKLRRLDYLTD